MTGTTSPFGVSAAKPILKYFLKTRFSPASSREALNRWEFLQGNDAGLDDKHQRREPRALLRPALAFKSAARSLEVGNIRILVLGHMR